MGHDKIKVAVSRLLKADCTKELSPEIYVSVKEGTHQTLSLHLLLRWSLSISPSLSFQIRLAFT